MFGIYKRKDKEIKKVTVSIYMIKIISMHGTANLAVKMILRKKLLKTSGSLFSM